MVENIVLLEDVTAQFVQCVESFIQIENLLKNKKGINNIYSLLEFFCTQYNRIIFKSRTVYFFSVVGKIVIILVHFKLVLRGPLFYNLLGIWDPLAGFRFLTLRRPFLPWLLKKVPFLHSSIAYLSKEQIF